MGGIFVALGVSGLVDLAGRAFPRALIRGIQLTVGLLFLEIAWGLVTDPPTSFVDQRLGTPWLVALAGLVLASLLLRRRLPVALVLVGIGAAVMILESDGPFELGPAALTLPSLDVAVFSAALTTLVLPQLPLSFANSCLAPADAARSYFGSRASRVTPGRLATTLGLANLAGGGIAGMPVCHGAGGLTAHYSHGARTGGAPLAIGVLLLGLALGLGAGLGALLPAFPLPILAGLLAGAGLLHIGLLRDLRGAREWGLAVLVGIVGVWLNLAVGLVVGLVLWWGPAGLRRLRPSGRRDPE
jgi:MFS superfamily sulfate permease-like transporter